jgi:hypothetical protein
MANPLRRHIKGCSGCASYRIFFSGNYEMVVRDGHWRVLRTSFQSRDLSCKGWSEIGRRAICDPGWNYHGSIEWPFYCHLGNQDDLTPMKSVNGGVDEVRELVSYMSAVVS